MIGRGAIPAAYADLLREDMPRMIRIWSTLYGVREIVGAADNPVIMNWAAVLTTRRTGILIKDDETPWCGLAQAYVALTAGYEPPPICVRASAWLDWGVPVDDRDPSVGDVGVMTRSGGNHVGTVVGHDATHIHLIGGNQGNAINVRRFAREGFRGFRRPPYKVGRPSTAVPVLRSVRGIVGGSTA